MLKLKRALSSLAPAAVRVRSASTRPARRALHVRRELRYPLEAGVADFLPPAALRTAVDWQDGLLDRLNDQVRGTESEGKSVLQTIIDTAADRQRVLAYNYASLAANNSFFLDSILPPAAGEPSHESSISPDLKAAIAASFTDLATLQERALAAAAGMAGPGWLWLVTDGAAQLALVPTFGPGTLLARAHHVVPHTGQETLARQVLFSGNGNGTDGVEAGERETSAGPGTVGSSAPSSTTSPFSGARTPSPTTPPDAHTPARSLRLSFPRAADSDSDSGFASSVRGFGGGGTFEQVQREALGRGQRVFPLWCVALQEHAWVSGGLGVWGKEEYVRRFFGVVDWKRASETYAKFYSSGR